MLININSDSEILNPYESKISELADKIISSKYISSEVFPVLTHSYCSLMAVSEEEIRQINRDNRDIDKVTDVISFALLDGGEEYLYEENIELGDIFINRNRVLSQAEDYGHSVKREFVFLFVHGLLHLFGYDHMNEKDEKVMFDLQKKIVGRLP